MAHNIILWSHLLLDSFSLSLSLLRYVSLFHTIKLSISKLGIGKWLLDLLTVNELIVCCFLMVITTLTNGN